MDLLHIKSGENRLVIDVAQGCIAEFIGNGKDLCKDNFYPVFVIGMILKNYETIKISSFDCAFVNVTKQNDTYVLTYLYKNDLNISVIIVNDKKESAFRFRISVKNNTEHLIEWVEFPGISIYDDLDGSKNSNILWPFNEGVMVSYTKDKMWPYEEPEYPSFGTLGVFPNMVQAQFMAYLYGNGGLYVGVHDKSGGVKQIDFYHEKERIKLQLRFYSGLYNGEDFYTDFDIVFRFFIGQWQDACEIYRTWYESVSEVKKIEEVSDLPEWYKESPLVVALPILGTHDTGDMCPGRYYPYDNILKEVKRISEITKSKLLVLLMQWESTAPWAPPYSWPPYGGEEIFKEFAKKLHAEGHYLGLYCSGFSWTQQSKVIPSYNKEKEFEDRNLQNEMCLSPKQTLDYSRICVQQRIGYDFCPTSKVLKEIIKEQVDGIFNSGVDYIQLLDQNHGGNSYFCYSRSHGHPFAPGAWQVDAVNEILASNKHDKLVFGCESAAAEPFINNLRFSDNRYTYAELVGDAVPAYAYIYHSRVNNFMGNQSCCPFVYTEGDYRYRLTYSFLAGDMMTIVLDNDGDIMHYWGAARKFVGKPDQIETFALIKELNGWRRVAKQYLCFGDMTKPKPYKCDCFCEFKVIRRAEFTKKVPKVLSNAFIYKEMRADIFVNFNKEPITISLPVSSKEKVFISSEDFAEGKVFYRTKEEITLKPLSAILIENPL